MKEHINKLREAGSLVRICNTNKDGFETISNVSDKWIYKNINERICNSLLDGEFVGITSKRGRGYTHHVYKLEKF